jgi:hemoglobin/transferrin/lactoferrin receptor protein
LFSYFGNSQTDKDSSKVKTIDVVVIAVNKWKQKSSEIPQIVSVISVKDVLLQNPQTAADLLGVSGKIFIQKSQLPIDCFILLMAFE